MPNLSGQKKSKKSKLHPAVAWLRAISGVSSIFGWGSLLMSRWFWTAAIFIDVGFLLVLVDLWLEPKLKPKAFWRFSGLGIALILSIFFNWAVVFAKAPLQVGAFMTDAEYPLGTSISGIAWRPEFTEVQVWMSNDSDKSYDDLNILVRPSNAIAAIAQSSSLPGVSIEDKGDTVVRMMSVSPEGSRSVVGLSLLASDAGYKIRCPHLPAKTALKIVVALADVKWGCSHIDPSLPMEKKVLDKNYVFRMKFDDFSTYWQGHPDGDVYAPRPTSSEWVRVEGDYTSVFKQYTVSERVQIGGNITVRSDKLR